MANENCQLVWTDSQQEYAPEGIYDKAAEFQGVKITDGKSGYEPGLQFTFKIMDGEHKGKLTGNIGSQKPSNNNISGRLIRGIIGADFQTGQALTLEMINAHIRKLYTVVVQKNKNGRPVVIQCQAK